jgi:hypothetical protein
MSAPRHSHSTLRFLLVAVLGHDAWTVGGEPCVFIDFGESVRSADGR